MAYAALPDMRIPYDNDGTVHGYSNTTGMGTDQPVPFGNGFSYLSQANSTEMNDEDAVATVFSSIGNQRGAWANWFFFPEVREITAASVLMSGGGGGTIATGTTGNSGTRTDLSMFQGSNDTTNGVDGTWETASIPGGWGSLLAPVYDLGTTAARYEAWRVKIGAISFVGGKRTLRIGHKYECGTGFSGQLVGIHLYGEKAVGQTPDDILYINHDDTPGVEYAAAEDFGDQALGTTVVRQFRLKNGSATKTANTVNIQCNDTDFAISTDGTTWVVTINIASLGPGAQSATMYIRCTTPAPGNPLGPRFARIVTTVGSWA